MDGFFSPREPMTVEQTVEKSRFIAVVYPVGALEDTEKNMQEVRERYPKARHYVFAFRLWHNRAEKASDDGEPQGTGGRPVLSVLAFREVWNAQLIVVRYFGGILLGTGGLTRAYGGTARLALDKADVARMSEHWLYSLCVSYGFYDEFRYVCSKQGWIIETVTYAEGVNVSLAVSDAGSLACSAWMTEEAHGSVVCLERERVWRGTAVR